MFQTRAVSAALLKRVMLTSCGLETKRIEEAFLEFLGKAPEQIEVVL